MTTVFIILSTIMPAIFHLSVAVWNNHAVRLPNILNVAVKRFRGNQSPSIVIVDMCHKPMYSSSPTAHGAKMDTNNLLKGLEFSELKKGQFRVIFWHFLQNTDFLQSSVLFP